VIWIGGNRFDRQRLPYVFERPHFTADSAAL
jgi:hypothetical protein